MTLNACHHGTGLNAYFARVPERLVLEGYRRWLAGYESGSVTPWEMTSTLYSDLLGADAGGRAVGDLWRFVRTLRRCASCPLRCFPFDARHICREECLTLGLIAALQHDDRDAETLCLSAIACAAMRHDVCAAAETFADTLSEFDQILLPIPPTAINDVLARADQRRIH